MNPENFTAYRLFDRKICGVIMCDEKRRKDIEKKFFEMNLHAAKNGLVESMNVVAKFYMEGVGVEKNLDEAIKWLKKVDDTGDEGGFCYHRHLPHKQGLTMSPAMVDAPTIYFTKRRLLPLLIFKYILAKEFTKCNKNLAAYIPIAKARGFSPHFGKIYSKYSESKNIDKAIFYLSKASEKNNTNALKKLAEIYKLQNDFEKMFECYQKGASLGNDVCMYEVACCYFFGRGVQQDDLKALEWFIKVVETYGWDYFCNSDIVRMITKIYSKHFKFTDEKFLNFYVTTEKLGYFNAMFGIAAQLYQTDKIRALKWYKLAADAGDFDAAVAVFYIKKNDLDGGDSDSYRDNYYLALEWCEPPTNKFAGF